MNIKELINQLSPPLNPEQPLINRYDFILFTDGSGTIIENPCAWCYVQYEVSEDTFLVGYGLTSRGTNNHAELLPVTHFLLKDSYKRNKKSEKRFGLVISDSEVTVKQGTGDYARNSNQMLWAAVDVALTTTNCVLDWKHVPRNTNLYNKFCDWGAGYLRTMAKDKLTDDLMRKFILSLE